VGADDLSRLLGDHYTLRLVVLNACDTGRGSALDVFSSTAGALVRRGVPAVVAMQFAISDPAAIRFAQTFYQNVAKRLPVDTSVMRARRALRRAKKDTLEWGTPVLYLRAADGRVFTTTTASAPAPQPDHPREQAGAAEVEALYDQALAAFWTERWDQAVELLRQVLAHQRDHPDAPAKLEHARRQQQLATRYAQACGFGRRGLGCGHRGIHADRRGRPRLSGRFRAAGTRTPPAAARRPVYRGAPAAPGRAVGGRTQSRGAAGRPRPSRHRPRRADDLRAHRTDPRRTKGASRR